MSFEFGIKIAGLLPGLGGMFAKLLAYPKEKREKSFKELVQPIYATLEDVHKDYLIMFDEIKQAIRKGNTAIPDIIDQLDTRRLQFETKRRSIEDQAWTLWRQSDRTSAMGMFWQSVLIYFSSRPGGGMCEMGNTLVNALRGTEPAKEASYSRADESKSASAELRITLADAAHEIAAEVGPNANAADVRRRFENQLLGAVNIAMDQLRQDWSRINEKYTEALRLTL